jgi:hypothetical protein
MAGARFWVDPQHCKNNKQKQRQKNNEKNKGTDCFLFFSFPLGSVFKNSLTV